MAPETRCSDGRRQCGRGAEAIRDDNRCHASFSGEWGRGARFGEEWGRAQEAKRLRVSRSATARGEGGDLTRDQEVVVSQAKSDKWYQSP
ncbi:hypothetical protein GUJ93_ZPchr0012g21654 [Zizania palustris]|uniref:Uncharacterized protein n=1 Tax=Zizania palustris TaxID=103762 RepID=A0A8J5WV18_ZIZPA|nr:hypothetical protein GUJ93_ZPchr0012g21654 [Zizania palustris]